MRLWHKDLIQYLPRRQLLGQWRECCLIAKSIATNGTPNHILVNKIMEYPMDHFHKYCIAISNEMERRNYKCDWQKCRQYFPDKYYRYMPLYDVFPGWHNDRYLQQCYYNLQEKYDCGGINKDEWDAISEHIRLGD